jgi:ketosteroid isomerase-like protein
MPYTLELIPWRYFVHSLRLILAGCLAFLPFASAHADDKADVLSTAKKFDIAFNAGDTKTAFSLCSNNAVIIDDPPPHVWQGANACQTWLNDLTAYDKKAGITEENVTIGAPWQLSVTGDRAYAVFPATYTHKTHGKPVVESGAVWTMALQKTSSGWIITGWAWSQHFVR